MSSLRRFLGLQLLLSFSLSPSHFFPLITIERLDSCCYTENCLHFGLLIISSPSFPLSCFPTSLSPSACQVEYDGLTGRVEFNSKGQRTNYTLRILEKHRGGHKEVRSHLLSCSSQVSHPPSGFRLETGQPTDFATAKELFSTGVIPRSLP